MIRGIVYTAVILQAFRFTAAFACDGQIGKVIYEDTFADDSGGWDFTANVATVKPPNFVFNLDSKNSNITSQVLTFHTGTDGDYCAEVILPKTIAPDNKYNLAVSFRANDYAIFGWPCSLRTVPLHCFRRQTMYGKLFYRSPTPRHSNPIPTQSTCCA